MTSLALQSSTPLDDRYLEWLYSQFSSVRNRNPGRSYWRLARKLYSTEFVWFIPNDDNRIADGKDLRYQFLDAVGFDEADPAWLDLECSMLEMLIALARRAAFEVDSMSPAEWFWQLLTNAGLNSFNDREYDDLIVSWILERIIYRNYAPSGEGGLFPLKRTRDDQRKVELWYQLSAYLLERYEP